MVEKNFWLVRISKKYVFWDTLIASPDKIMLMNKVFFVTFFIAKIFKPHLHISVCCDIVRWLRKALFSSLHSMLS